MGTCVTETPAHYEAPREAEDDLTLVHATKRGNVAAFDKIVRRYDRKLLRIAQSVTHNREEAEDTVQEAFFKAYQKLDQFHEKAKFFTWMVRIVLNEAMTKLRKQRTAREESLDSNFPRDSDVLPGDLADRSPHPQEFYGAMEFQGILIKCLGPLQPGLRVVFVLRDIEEPSISESCEALGLSAIAVKSRLYRARLQLRERLGGLFRQRDGQSSAIDLTSTINDWRVPNPLSWKWMTSSVPPTDTNIFGRSVCMPDGFLSSSDSARSPHTRRTK
jgi:RNA polymerase sigma-70 factor (ECF subfamily)